ncbi:MAG: M48 family metallopeptidase [Verrucomicrobiota bacterium]
MDASASTDSVYGPSPNKVPKGLTDPTSKYKLHAWLAMGGLMLFAVLYVGLAVWFGYSSYRLFVAMGNGGGMIELIEAFGSAVIAVFLVKGLFFHKRSDTDTGFEVTALSEPRLFDFINRIADETGAPRPHKVFLSANVNACVFYDLTLLNFLFPTRKNLEIGLGLVNVLTISEFKAVLSHEFGHFAQRSMAVGRWVYTAQQVANQLIYHRDALDSFLNVLSSIDIRIAWIGWILRLIVWALRSVLDSLLSLVLLAERALSREMEFQADLVAVSASGSDALIHGLFRLPAADQAWDEAKGIIGEQLENKSKPSDVFTVQSRILELKRHILDDPDFGGVPPLPTANADQHRIFNADIAQPPQMWATHPQSHLREENAKRIYVPAALDNRSAWECFANPDDIRRRVTAYILSEIEHPEQSPEETIAAVDKAYDKEFYNPVYRGIYLGRSICDHASTAAEMMGQPTPCDSSELYPESLVDELERLRNLAKEKGMLEALRDRQFESADGIIRFRGEIIKRSGLGEAIETSAKDFETSRQKLYLHDQRCRGHHLAIAASLPGGWDTYLRGLVGVLHFADHKYRDILDAFRKLNNTFAVVIADGNISKGELRRLVGDAVDLHQGLAEVFRTWSDVVLDRNLLERLGAESWTTCFPCDRFGLAMPYEETIGDWFQSIEAWIGLACEPLGRLRDAALEELLKTEAMLAKAHTESLDPGVAPPPCRVPAKFRTLLHGKERSLQQKLNLWDSFQTASGIGPASARFLVAASIVLTAVYLTLPANWREWLSGILS